ncbi:MAG: NAD(P)H-quinone oxidoreductase [Deltaproteobacteria bacterium]|nr:NAD(P)H-quinone oxidoreductase [Deltaproteobacteria bacterium]MCW5805069.1 NAD(P)H-quinone oxidoreductase [Deltaproteobacteria bacterium]
MRAVAITRTGGPEVLAVVERDLPEPSRGEVRVRVHATAVNRADLLQRMGAYPAPPDAPPDIPGLEIAGEVAALGPGVERLAVGDRVFGLVGGGGYAEAVVAHERALARIPAGVAYEDAAAIPEAYITAYDAMVTQGALAGGQPVLVHAAGSGVGTAAVQLGRALGAFTIGTARTPDKLERARALGLHAGIVPTGDKPRFADQVRAAAPDGPAVVLELVGGAYLEEDLRCVQPLGRIVLVGLLAGARAELDLGLVLRKRVRLLGTVLRSRPLEEKIAVMRTFEAEVVPLLARGAIAPVVDAVLDLDRAGEAHARMASNAGFGKIILRC